MSNTVDETYCRPCIYYGPSTKTCDYILLADQRRPCSAGEGCTARITRKEQLMAKPTWDTETGYQMFLAGNSDTAIGRALGVAAGTVNFYKRKHWLSKEPTGGDTVNRAPVENGKEEPVMQPKAINPPVDTAMYETVEAAARELKGIQAICTADAIQSLWNWKSIYDLQRARASIDYLLKRLGEENAAR